MLSFKEFLIERVYRLSNAEQANADNIVDSYMRIFDPKALKMPIAKILSLGPEKVYKKYINEKGFITIGFVKFYDDASKTNKEIPVYVSFDKKSTDKGMFVRDEDGHEYIILHYYKLKYNRNVIEDAFVHELNHAKQPYKYVGKNYSRSKLDYYTDPVEVHNYVSNIISAIEKEYVKADPNERKNIINFIEDFARHGTLPENELSNIIKRIGKDEFVNYLYDNKDDPKIGKEYKRFINKLHWLYTNLRDYENR